MSAGVHAERRGARSSSRTPLRTVGFKVFVGVTLIIAASTAFLVSVLTERERERIIQAKVQAGSMVMEVLSKSLAAPLDFEDVDATKAELEDLRASADVVSAAVYSAKGELVAEVGAPAAKQVERAERTTTLADRVEFVRDVRRRERAHGTVVVVLSLEAENALFAESRTLILQWGLALGFVSALLLVVFIQRGVVSPLRTLADAVKQVEEGADAAVPASRRDEVGDLARAFNAMSSAVRDREDRLRDARERVEHLLDHMRQSTLVLDEDMKPTGFASKAARTLFGEDLEDASAEELLFTGLPRWQAERQAFAEWLALVAATRGEDRAEVLGLAPRESRRERDGKLEVLELEFVSLGSPRDHVMLLATDVTAHRELLREKERETREVEALRYLVGSAHVLAGFLTRARERVEFCRGASGEPASRITALQHVHTIKGEALALGLEEVATAARTMEESLATRDSLAPQSDANEAYDFAELLATLDAAEARFADLSPDGREGLVKVPVDRRDVAELVAALRDPAAPAKARALAHKLASRPFAELASSLVSKVPAWGEQAGKEARLEVEGERTLVPSELAPVLPGVLTHLVRNAIAHGLETPSERDAAKKPAIGLIRISCREAPAANPSDVAGCIIEVHNDGRGLGLDGHAAARLFQPGSSTSRERSDLAGLGVGLSAARADLLRVGYGIRFATADGEVGVRLVIAREERDSFASPTWTATKEKSSS